MNLGKRDVVEKVTCPPGKRDKLFADEAVAGFMLRVTETGNRIFLFQYRSPIDGKLRRLKLGAFGEITPAQARRKAEEARGAVLGGNDPVLAANERRRAAQAAGEARARQVAADAFTLRVLIGDWVDRGLADRSESYRREAPRALLLNLAALLDLPARSLDAETVLRSIDEISRERGVQMANRTLSY